MKKLILILFILTVSLSFAQAQLTVNPFLGTCNPVCSFVAEKNPYFRINNPETTIKYGIELHKQNQRLAYKSGIYYQNSGSSIYTEIPEYLRNTDLKYSQSNIIAATTYAFLAGSDILLKNFNISQRYSLQTKAGVALNFLLTMNGASMPTSTNIAGMVDTLWVNDTITHIRRGGLAISVNFDILLFNKHRNRELIGFQVYYNQGFINMLHTRVDYILNSLNGTFLLQSKGTVYGFMVYFPIRLTQRKPIYQTPHTD